MKILIAPDSFKDALTAPAACEAIRRGVLRALPMAEVQLFPLADGGEGTAAVLAWHLGGELVQVTVSDPLLRPVEAQYFRFGEMAFVEMAQASGLQRLGLCERNPLKTSTFGTGELILDALKKGARHIHLAIGGSATNDAGMGMAAALGWRFLAKNGAELAPIGENLAKVYRLVPPDALPNFLVIPEGNANPQFTVLCDVTNPLHGPQGAAHVFAKQKGADEAAVAMLDEGLRRFSGVVAAALGHDFSQQPGAGAAGGLGFGAMAFLGAAVRPGAAAVMELVGFEEVVKKADLVITGEGRLDGQTRHGKLVAVICQKAKMAGVPVVAICGAVDATDAEVAALGLAKAVQLRLPGETLAASLSRTQNALAEMASNILKTMQLQK